MERNRIEQNRTVQACGKSLHLPTAGILPSTVYAVFLFVCLFFLIRSITCLSCLCLAVSLMREASSGLLTKCDFSTPLPLSISLTLLFLRSPHHYLTSLFIHICLSLVPC